MPAYPQPRGNSLFGFLIAFVVGGLIGAGIACLAGWICGHSGGGGGGGTPVTLTPNQCQSEPNACGLVSIGTYTYQCPTAPAGHSYTFVDPNGNNTNSNSNAVAGGLGAPTCYEVRPGTSGEPAQVYVVDSNGNYATATATKVCDATPPDNSQCPAAVVSNFAANPSVLTTPPNQSGQTTLTWSSTNATYCDISGDNGFAYSGSDSGSTAATGLTSTTVFTLTCWDGQGGPKDTKSIRVIVNARYQEQ